MEFNAPDERSVSEGICIFWLLLILPHRGIDVVRNKIKSFAQKVTLPPGLHKMIILDEADRSVPHTVSRICFLFATSQIV